MGWPILGIASPNCGRIAGSRLYATQLPCRRASWRPGAAVSALLSCHWERFAHDEAVLSLFWAALAPADPGLPHQDLFESPMVELSHASVLRQEK